MENACRAARAAQQMQEQPEVKIVAVVHADKCVIKVVDNGNGFADGDTTHLFDRFETQGDYASFQTGIGFFPGLWLKHTAGRYRHITDKTGRARFSGWYCRSLH